MGQHGVKILSIPLLDTRGCLRNTFTSSTHGWKNFSYCRKMVLKMMLMMQFCNQKAGQCVGHNASTKQILRRNPNVRSDVGTLLMTGTHVWFSILNFPPSLGWSHQARLDPLPSWGQCRLSSLVTGNLHLYPVHYSICARLNRAEKRPHMGQGSYPDPNL